MKLIDLMDLTDDIEKRFPVDEWFVDGIAVWPLIRIKLHFGLFYAYKTKATAGSGHTVARYARHAAGMATGAVRHINASLRDRQNNGEIDEVRDAVFLSDGISYVLLNNQWYEKFCDPFIDLFRSKNISSLLLSPQHTYYIPRHTRSLFIQPRIDRLRVANMLFDSVGNRISMSLRGYEAYADFLKAKALPVAADTTHRLKKDIAYIRRLSAFFQGIFVQTRPTLGFVVSYYSELGMAFNLACREFGIPSVEIQHGGGPLDLHVAYARWNTVPREGYPMLPSLFWCWSKTDAAAVLKWNGSCSSWHDAIGGGNLFLDLWRQNDHQLVRTYDERVSALKKNRGSVKHVLFTIQEKFADTDTLGMLRDIMRKAGPQWFWWIRLHPCIQHETHQIMQSLRASETVNCDVLNATMLPLYALLRNVHLHMTHSSSSVVEATSFHVPTVLIGEYGVELFPDQIASGWAQPAFAVPAVIEAMERQVERADGLRSQRPPDHGVDAGGIDRLLMLIKSGRTNR